MQADEQEAGGEDPRPSAQKGGCGEDEVECRRRDEECADRRGVGGAGANAEGAGAAVDACGGEDREEEHDGRGARVGVPGGLGLRAERGGSEQDGGGSEDECGGEEDPGVNTGAGEGLERMKGHLRGNARFRGAEGREGRSGRRRPRSTPEWASAGARGCVILGLAL